MFLTGLTKFLKMSTSICMISYQLHINMGKCCCMHFRPKKTFKSASRTRNSYPNFMPALKINGQKIPQVHSTKFLGVVIDDRLL